jgi:hypothetical protein
VFNFVDNISGEKVSLVVSEVTGKWSIFLKEGEKVRVRHGYVSIENNAITHTTWEDHCVICIEGHELEYVGIINDDRACDECERDRTDFGQADGWKCYRCHQCEHKDELYDLCAECFESKKEPGHVLITTVNTNPSVIEEIKDFKVNTKIVKEGIRKAAYFEKGEFMGYYPIKSVKFDGATTKYRVQWKDGSKQNTLKNENELLVDAPLEIKDIVIAENEEDLAEIIEVLGIEKKQRSYKVRFKNSNACSTFTEAKLTLYKKNEAAKPHERRKHRKKAKDCTAPLTIERLIEEEDSKIEDKTDFGKEDYDKSFVEEMVSKTFMRRFERARNNSRRANKPKKIRSEEKQNELKRKREEEETKSTVSQDSKSTKASTTDGKSSRKPKELTEVGEPSGLTYRPRRKIVRPARYGEEAEKKR